MKQNEKWISLLYNNDEMKMVQKENNTESEWAGENERREEKR